MTEKRKRREFPVSVKLAAWERSDGRCEECGKKLFPGKFVYDHTCPDALGGEPALENCKVLCDDGKGSCNDLKTNGTKHNRLDGDKSKIAKANRIKAKNEGTFKRPKRKMKSRNSFGNGGLRKKLNGQVVPKDGPARMS